ncbi:MMPL family transporter [Pseudomonas sp. J452]|uniref:efflux RND transporter permease subunit n=1 Tax=Pseudomonas sp. J452 TaxID=2898441 RepID=UPI0021ADAD52|nr:MMPL family transporter [Pseudomonas sp. J452]UUY08375.1 MMPL family transporter [Pseudomonas sp. J452]
MNEKIALAVARWRWQIVIMTFALFFLAAYGAKKIGVTSSYEIFFGQDNAELLAYEKLKSSYTDTDNLVFVVVPKDGTVFSQRALAMMHELTEAAGQLPYSNRVDSITNFQHTEANGDDLKVENLVKDPAALTPQSIEAIKQVALHEPSLVNNLVSTSGHTAAIYVTFNLKNEHPDEVKEVAAAAQEIMKPIQARYSDIEIKPIGLTMLSYTYGQAAKIDMGTLTPLMLLLILVVVAFSLKSFMSLATTLLVVLMSMLSTLGCVGWLGYKINSVSAVVPTVVAALIVVYCVHMLVSFMQDYRKGMPKRNAVIEAVKGNVSPFVFTSLTTIIGFLVMNFNDVPPYRELGNIMAIAVTIGFYLSLFFLPALILILPVRQVKDIGKHDRMTNLMRGLANFVIAKRNGILIVTAVVLVGSILLIPKNTLNEKFVEQFDERFQFRKDSDYFTDNIGGIYSIEYSIKRRNASENDIYSPDFNAKVDEFSQWLRSLPEIRHVLTFSDTLKRINKNMHGDDSEWYRLPDNKELTAQYVLLYENSLPYGQDLNNQLTLRKDATRVVVRFDNMMSSDVIKLEQKIATWWDSHGPEYDVTGASTTLMFTHITQRSVDSMIWGTLIGFALIAILLIAALGSLRLGLLSLIPNIVPMVVALALWAVLNGEVGMSFTITVVVVLGIVVDDTIHFLHKYQYAIRELGYSQEGAVRYAFSTVGVALWVSSLALIIGFLVLGLSGFARNADLGLLSAIALFLGLITELLLLPPLLLMLKPETSSARASEQALEANR